MTASPGLVTAASANLPPPKREQEKGPGGVTASVHPTNARSAGIFKGLRPGTKGRSFAAHGTFLTLQIRKNQCLQGFPPTAKRLRGLFLPRFEANFTVKPFK